MDSYFPLGYPKIEKLTYSLKILKPLKIKQGLDPQRTIYLRLKGNREIPLTVVSL
jgi:hypothetical protein